MTTLTAKDFEPVEHKDRQCPKCGCKKGRLHPIFMHTECQSCFEISIWEVRGESTRAKIQTKDPQGNPNGFLIPLWNILEDDWRPEQAYITAVYPHCVKGPHLHQSRIGRFRCVFGNVAIVTREGESYNERRTGQDYEYRLIEVAAGTPAAIYNLGSTTALVVNMPSPAWCAEDPDEWPVENWRYQV